MKGILTIGALAIFAAGANAAPAPVPGATFIGPNSGYIEFLNPSLNQYDGGPVCPDGTIEVDTDGRCIGARKWGAAAAAVPLKTALDQHLRAGSYEVVGFAPMGNKVVVYYRNLANN